MSLKKDNTKVLTVLNRLIAEKGEKQVLVDLDVSNETLKDFRLGIVPKFETENKIAEALGFDTLVSYKPIKDTE